MKAMILAAGAGTRVRPLTLSRPKPMLPVLGKPVMEYLVETLAANDCRQIMCNVSHHADQIRDYFRDGRRWGVEIGWSFEGTVEGGELIPQAIGSAGALRRIQDFSGYFDETTVVLCGDALIDLDLRDALKRHRESGAVASIVTLEVARDKVSEYGVVVCDEHGRVQSFQEKPTVDEAKSNLVNTGIYIFEPEVIERIPAGEVYDIGGQLLPGLVEEGAPFFAQSQPFTWVDIGRIRDFWSYTIELMQGTPIALPMPGIEVRPGVHTGLNVKVPWDQVVIEGPVYIGSGTEIEVGAEIVGPTWIEAGCLIERGAHLVRTVMFENTRIAKDTSLVDTVCAPAFCVDAEGNDLGCVARGEVGDAREPRRGEVDA